MGFLTWMDIDGGMRRNVYDSMAEGVTGAGCVVAFMSAEYERSENCRLELQFAKQVRLVLQLLARGWTREDPCGSVALWLCGAPRADPPGVLRAVRRADRAGDDAAAALQGAPLPALARLYRLNPCRAKLERLEHVRALREHRGSAGAGLARCGDGRRALDAAVRARGRRVRRWPARPADPHGDARRGASFRGR